ncbi:uncharacterized protein LOC132124825 [Carassius carassius]|uniref:uncharacterized protein LOC132124825 n=1 Tax=Carassius carassius TaxID=217509 RepID=UPI002868871E|nr:uncharacterized protein LOC132124825 [Carassius carassius]
MFGKSSGYEHRCLSQRDSVYNKSQGLLSWICNLIVTFLVFLVTFITFPISGWFVLKVVPNYERTVVFRLGQIRPPKGLVVLVLPFIDQWQRVDLRTRAFSVPPCKVTTKDSGLVSVDYSSALPEPGGCVPIQSVFLNSVSVSRVDGLMDAVCSVLSEPLVQVRACYRFQITPDSGQDNCYYVDLTQDVLGSLHHHHHPVVWSGKCYKNTRALMERVLERSVRAGQ